MAERFNGRSEPEVLTITVGSHRDLERLLKGYNKAYNARPQRVLKGKSPNEVVRSRLPQVLAASACTDRCLSQKASNVI